MHGQSFNTGNSLASQRIELSAKLQLMDKLTPCLVINERQSEVCLQSRPLIEAGNCIHRFDFQLWLVLGKQSNYR